MNKDRRARIDDIREALIKVQDDLQAIVEGDFDAVKTDEREAFDNMSEGLQQTELGQRIEAAADKLDEAWDEASEAMEAIGRVIDQLDEAKE